MALTLADYVTFHEDYIGIFGSIVGYDKNKEDAIIESIVYLLCKDLLPEHTNIQNHTLNLNILCYNNCISFYIQPNYAANWTSYMLSIKNALHILFATYRGTSKIKLSNDRYITSHNLLLQDYTNVITATNGFIKIISLQSESFLNFLKGNFYQSIQPNNEIGHLCNTMEQCMSNKKVVIKTYEDFAFYENMGVYFQRKPTPYNNY
ncbi:hypothetical protein MrNuV_ORF080 [Macrobrachium rosenbergii nudivirus]|nr:hypothetical protein MrNuV_ORF080 [Macrobrachium rosenbergii nudivirus]